MPAEPPQQKAMSGPGNMQKAIETHIVERPRRDSTIVVAESWSDGSQWHDGRQPADRQKVFKAREHPGESLRRRDIVRSAGAVPCTGLAPMTESTGGLANGSLSQGSRQRVQGNARLK